MQRIYYRDASGFITMHDAKDWTKEDYLRAHSILEYAYNEKLKGWPDSVVAWYAIGGDNCGTMRAVGFPVYRSK